VLLTRPQHVSLHSGFPHCNVIWDRHHCIHGQPLPNGRTSVLAFCIPIQSMDPSDRDSACDIPAHHHRPNLDRSYRDCPPDSLDYGMLSLLPTFLGTGLIYTMTDCNLRLHPDRFGAYHEWLDRPKLPIYSTSPHPQPAIYQNSP
jgi:hypothetical protein